jgi:hypothetical protein
MGFQMTDYIHPWYKPVANRVVLFEFRLRVNNISLWNPAKGGIVGEFLGVVEKRGCLFGFRQKAPKCYKCRSLLNTTQVTKDTEEGHSTVSKWNITSLGSSVKRSIIIQIDILYLRYNIEDIMHQRVSILRIFNN